MVFIFSVVLKTFLTSLPLRDTRCMLETVPSEDQNNNLQVREACFENKTKYSTFARSPHCYTLLVQLLPYTEFFSLTTVLSESKLIIKQGTSLTRTHVFQESPIHIFPLTQLY